MLGLIGLCAGLFQHCRSGALGVLPSSNIFARPVEGLSILYDATQDAIVKNHRQYEGRPAPPHDIDPAEYLPAL